MNADEVVQALRDDSHFGCYISHGECSKLRLAAAALIESLTAQLDAYKSIGLTPGDVKDLQELCKENGLAKYVDLIVEAKRQMGKSNEHSIEQDERIERLEAQLSASQARGRAAVVQTCDGCREQGKWENEVEYGYPSPCTRCKRYCADNWRGPEAGEGVEK